MMNSTEILKSTEMDTYSQNLISSDTDLLNKVKQVIELTGCSNDIAVTTLYDSNYNIEIAIDKIFEQTQRTLVGEINKINSDWKEVAKYKKKQSLEINASESNIDDVKEMTDNNKIVNDKPRPMRGGSGGRGRARFTQNYNRSYESFNNKLPSHGIEEINSDSYGNKGSISRGRGRRSQYRLTSNRGRTRHYMNQENQIFDGNPVEDSGRYYSADSNKWDASYDVCNDWLSDHTGTDSDKQLDNHYDDNLPHQQHQQNHHHHHNHHHRNSALKTKSDSNWIDSSTSPSVEAERKTIDSTTVVAKDDSGKSPAANPLNPLELVAKSTNKVDIFGGFSRTKAPTPSSRVPLEPVKLLTASGVKSTPVNNSGFNFSFGLNFNDYSASSQSSKFGDSSTESFISKIIANNSQQQQQSLPFDSAAATMPTVKSSGGSKDSNEYLIQSTTESQLSASASNNLRIASDKSKPQEVSGKELFSNQRHPELLVDKQQMGVDTASVNVGYSGHQSLNTAILSSTASAGSQQQQQQLCPPPGMSNAHLMHQFQNNPQYFSLLNIPNGSSIFSGGGGSSHGCNLNQVSGELGDAGPSSDDSSSQFMHPVDPSSIATGGVSSNNKEYKLSKQQQHPMGNVIQSMPNPNQQQMSQKDAENGSGQPHSSSTILSAMTMPNICCFPQVYMNTFANFMPTVPPGHSSQSSLSSQQQQSTEVTQSPNSNNKQQQQQQIQYNLPIAHRNYPQLSDEFDELLQNKQKFQRSQQQQQNYVASFGQKSSQNPNNDDDRSIIEVGVVDNNNKSTKLAQNNAQVQNNRQSGQPNQNVVSNSNRSSQQQQQQQQHQVQQQQQQSVSNDPRFLAFHHQHSNHPYQNNMFNCVTATGAHPTAHPYAMAHQGGGLQQLHPQLQLMQQQMHNFPQSYQFQEHLMTSIVSNPSSRSNISQGTGSSGIQSRSNRSNNQLWHP